MADDQIATGMQLAHQLADDLALSRVVEIDHHVAQEDHMELADLWKMLVQVNLAKLMVNVPCLSPLPSWQYLLR
jgi:hypothetical protein